MGKIPMMVVTLFIINLGMVMFIGTSATDSSLWTTFISPVDWTGNALIDFIMNTIALAGVAGIVVGLLTQEARLGIFAGLATILASQAQILYLFFQQVQSAALGPFATLGATLFVSSMMIIYIFLVIDWWRERD